jgi:hypothetical protein
VRLIFLRKSVEHGRMTSLSDTLTVGLVLVLLFGSIALYLYTRIQQAEQKISLLESILLDLKMSAEVKSYTELPAHSIGEGVIYPSTSEHTDNYMPFDETDENEDNTKTTSEGSSSESSTTNNDADDITTYKSVIAEAVHSETGENIPSASRVSVNYEAMTLKELQTLAKTRGITSAGSMKKGAIIEALKTSDRSSSTSTATSSPVEPGSSGTSSFLETSSSFPGTESQ